MPLMRFRSSISGGSTSLLVGGGFLAISNPLSDSTDNRSQEESEYIILLNLRGVNISLNKTSPCTSTYSLWLGSLGSSSPQVRTTSQAPCSHCWHTPIKHPVKRSLGRDHDDKPIVEGGHNRRQEWIGVVNVGQDTVGTRGKAG